MSNSRREREAGGEQRTEAIEWSIEPGPWSLLKSYRTSSRVDVVVSSGVEHLAYRKARCLLDATVRPWVALLLSSPRYLSASGYDDMTRGHVIGQHAHVRVHYASGDTRVQALVVGCDDGSAVGQPLCRYLITPWLD